MSDEPCRRWIFGVLAGPIAAYMQTWDVLVLFGLNAITGRDQIPPKD